MEDRRGKLLPNEKEIFLWKERRNDRRHGAKGEARRGDGD